MKLVCEWSMSRAGYSQPVMKRDLSITAKAKEVLADMLKSYNPEDGRVVETPDTPLSKMTAERDKLLGLLVRCADTNMVPSASQILEILSSADARGFTPSVDSDAVNEHDSPEPVIRFKKWVCNIRLSEYENGRLRIDLISAEEDEKIGVLAGEPITCATVNLPDHSIDDDCVCIKDYSENETMLSVLTSEGLVGSTLRSISSAHVSIPVVFKTEKLMAMERAFRENASQESGIIQTRNMM